jgi:NADPH:quinone reductase-like Zn-dependent oxidoreductase
MRALRVYSQGKAAVVSDIPIPALRPEYILVRTVAVALNPTDWKSSQGVNDPVTIGCDYAGIVEDVGEKVTKPFKKGDHVCGFVMANNSMQFDDGADQEYLVAKADLQIKMPDYLSFEEAATLGVGKKNLYRINPKQMSYTRGISHGLFKKTHCDFCFIHVLYSLSDSHYSLHHKHR